MARVQELVTCPPGVWTELTNSDTSVITFQVISGAVKVRYTTGSAPSALSDPGYEYRSSVYLDGSGEGEVNVSLSSMTGLSGADRAFAIPTNGRPAKVLVDHP